jgi:iron complex transport system substrate-binding protein
LSFGIRWRSRSLIGLSACGILLAVPAAIAQVAVEDDLGRRIELSEPPGRIVSLVPAVTEIVFALDAGERLAGRSTWDVYPPEVLEIANVGDALRADAERVLSVNPDLVILYSGPDNARSVEQFDELDVPTLAIRIDELADLHRNIFRLGVILGQEGAATLLSSAIREELDSVRRSTRGRDRPRVYYDIAWPPAITVGRGSYLDTLIAIAGGENIFHDLAAPSPRVSLEAIAARAPDIIVVPVEAGSQPRSPADRTGWKSVTAVREGAIRHVDSGLMHRLGPRVGEAARSLAAVLHPDAGP